ncbi:MAG: ABC transporter permease [Acidobacteria bacterium]|nr:ABC transporter permease [Acidobacteriota bacterium]
MTQFGNLIRKDVRRSLRAPAGILLQMAIPLAIAMIFGVVFSPSRGGDVIRFKLLLSDEDGSFASQFIQSSFTQGDLAKMVDLQKTDTPTGRALMNEGKASAMLIVPRGFGDDLLEGRPVSLRLIKNPSESILPEVAADIVKSVAVLADYGARVLNAPLRAMRTLGDGEAFPSEAEWLGVSAAMRISLERVHRYVMPPVVKIETVGSTEPKQGAGDLNYFALFLPGMALMGLLFIANHCLRDLAEEMDTGRLRRIFTAPVGPGEVLGAKLAYAFLLTFLSFGIMSAVGVALFGMRPRLPWLYLAGGLVSAAACTGIMALVYCLVSGVGRSEAVTSIIIVVMCMVGGSYFPIESLPDFFIHPARATVNYWSIDLLRGGLSGNIDPGRALLDTGVLMGISLLTLMAGTRILGRRLMAGVSR